MASGIETEQQIGAEENPTQRDTKRTAIHTAAIGEFSERGFAATSMANIATAAGMSRPALYQYFRNKGDIFASAFVALFDNCVDEAIAALEEPGTTTEQLDGFLQRFEGDLWERMAASSHSDEILSLKTDQTADAITEVMDRLWRGLAAYLERVTAGRPSADSTTRAEWTEVLRLSPKGFKLDQPTVASYRRRLTALARGVAADIDAS